MLSTKSIKCFGGKIKMNDSKINDIKMSDAEWNKKLCIQHIRKKICENKLENIYSRKRVQQHCLGYIQAFYDKRLITEEDFNFLENKLTRYLRYVDEI